jgi:tight adherence protein B
MTVSPTVAALLAVAAAVVATMRPRANSAPRAALIALAGGSALWPCIWHRLDARVRARRSSVRRRTAVIELCDGLAAELHAGVPVQQALEHACRGDPEWSRVVVTARVGGDVVGALREAASRPGAGGLFAVAAAWEVSARSGAALAVVLDRIGVGLRDEEEARAEVAASLAPARATARLLAGLPVFGLALGMSMGARPLDFLLDSGLGLVCLVGGLLLAGLGVIWVERLVDAVEV